jgi:hypothetical protein
VAPPVRIVVLLALVLFGVAACAATSNGGKSSWRFVSVHGSQQSGKHKR